MSAKIVTYVVLAGVGLGVLLYKLLNTRNSEREHGYHRNPSPTRRWNPSPDPEIRPSTSGRCRARNPPEVIPNCEICKATMSGETVELECSHIFHRDCYKAWNFVVSKLTPNAILCPTCENNNRETRE